MAIAKKGSGLPEGTTVYMANFGKSSHVWQSTIKRRYDPFRIDLEYIFDPADGLWATTHVRALWEQHPHLHPHASLFTLLYKKLEP